jgi:hypothetical protein
MDSLRCSVDKVPWLAEGVKPKQWCYNVRIGAFGDDFAYALNTIRTHEGTSNREVNLCRGRLGPGIERSCRSYADMAVEKGAYLEQNGCVHSDDFRWDARFESCFRFYETDQTATFLPEAVKNIEALVKACDAKIADAYQRVLKSKLSGGGGSGKNAKGGSASGNGGQQRSSGGADRAYGNTKNNTVKQVNVPRTSRGTTSQGAMDRASFGNPGHLLDHGRYDRPAFAAPRPGPAVATPRPLSVSPPPAPAVQRSPGLDPNIDFGGAATKQPGTKIR